MQKIWEKYKDRWWWGVLGLFVIYLVNKFFDYVYSLIRIYVIKFLPLIGVALNYKISLSVSLLLSILFGFIITAFIYRLYKYNKIKKRNFRIINALYGNNEHFFDITSELNNAVSDNKLNIVLSNNIAGDPIYGVQKIGKIMYQYNGKNYEKTYIEGDLVLLP